MGIMTLSQFRTELKFNLENRNDSGLTDARLNLWINQAYLHLGRPEVRKHRELQFTHDYVLILDQNEYSLANTTKRLLGVRNLTYFYGTSVAGATR